MGSICQNCIEVRKKKITNADSESNNLIFIDSKKKYSSEEYDTILKDFINKTIEKDEFYDYKDGDEVFNLQKIYEKNELNKFFQLNKNKINEQIETSLNTTNKILINFDMNKLVSDVINLENGKNTYSEKIGNIIKEVQSNNSKYINIIVIGKHGIGKKTLINKIFKLKNIKLNIMPNQEKEIEEYKNNGIPFFRFALIKFNNNFPFDLNDARIRIMNYIAQKKRLNYINNYVNCIWYCFNNGSLSKEEIELINSLNNIYKDNIPIILIHTMSIDQQKVNLIQNLNINKKDVVILLSEDYLYQPNGMHFKSFGIDHLILKTINICKNNPILYKDINKDIINKIKTDNSKICQFTNGQIIQKFINEYKSPKNNDEFIQYIIQIFIINIKFFLLKFISNESINRINQENILAQSIIQFIQLYEKNSKELVEPTVYPYALNFINNQKEIEKEKKINVKNIRNLENMQKNIKKYLIDNYKYISQKNYIYNILYKTFNFFCDNFRKELDNLSEQIILKSNIKGIIFQYLETDIKNFFNIKNNINNNTQSNHGFINNENRVNSNDLNNSKVSDTIIGNNNYNMNIINNNNLMNNNINNYNYAFNKNNKDYINNMKNNINILNNINLNNEATLNLPSESEVIRNNKTTKGNI